MDSCPDNSTACLLRKLLEINQGILEGITQANNEYNWDPATFSVTVVIGVLAFLVACLTVFQGLLAAGPGRIKAGKTALGPWSKLSKSRFSWTEFGVRSTAIVPVIEISWSTAFGVTRGIFPERSDEIYVAELEEYGATWANLLVLLGMTDVKWAQYKTVGTDYLPTDIQGPPVTAHLRTLITLAAIADDHCTLTASVDARFVTMTGLHSSISIREHPVLGTVAAFESHGTPRTVLPYIFMHAGQDPEQFHPGSNDADDADDHAGGMIDPTSSAFDAISTYCLCTGFLQTGVGWCDLTTTSLADIEMDICTLRATFLVQRRTNWSKWNVNPTIFTALITGEFPSRPRLFPKRSVELADAARRLTQGSIWQINPFKFSDGLENLLHAYLPFTKNFKSSPEQARKVISDVYSEWNDFDHSWTRLQSKQRESIARSNRLHWTKFQRAFLPMDSGPLPSFVEKSSQEEVITDCRRKAFALRKFIDVICKNSKLVLVGKSRLNRLFPWSSIAALQVGFQAEVLLLDHYLLRQDEKDVACALMVLLREISLSEEPLTPPTPKSANVQDDPVAQSPPEHTEGDNTPHDDTSGMFSKFFHDASFGEAYGIGQIPAGFQVQDISLNKIKLRPKASSTGGDNTKGTEVTISPTNPEDCAQEWAHVWYSRREKVEDRERLLLLAEVMRYRALLCIAILDLCADSGVLMAEHFERATVRII